MGMTGFPVFPLQVGTVQTDVRPSSRDESVLAEHTHPEIYEVTGFCSPAMLPGDELCADLGRTHRLRLP